MLNQRFVNVIYFIIFLIISVYTVFKISPVLSGPEILINKSTLITNKDTRLHNISGTVLRASEIRVFDAILNTDKNGNWNTDILLYNDNTLVEMSATDKYNNITKERFYIVRR